MLSSSGTSLGASAQMEERESAVGWEHRGRRDRALAAVRADLGEAEAASAIEAGRRADDQRMIELIMG